MERGGIGVDLVGEERAARAAEAAAQTEAAEAAAVAAAADEARRALAAAEEAEEARKALSAGEEDEEGRKKKTALEAAEKAKFFAIYTPMKADDSVASPPMEKKESEEADATFEERNRLPSWREEESAQDGRGAGEV